MWYAREQNNNNVIRLGQLESDLRDRIAAARDAIDQADIAASAAIAEID